jgi:pyruvate ferredoxin oxidoreductase alpha subunit
MEISSAVMSMKSKPAMINRIYGLGGRDYLPDQAEGVLDELVGIVSSGQMPIIKEYIGLRD